jgi:hypothetical protein
MKYLILCLAASSSAFAQTQVKTCEAWCFQVRSDGVSLAYAGKQKTFATSTAQAFVVLQNTCYDGILLKRSLKSVAVVQKQEWNEDQFSKSESEYGYHFLVTRTKDHRRVYSISRPSLQAVFDFVDATEGNSCRAASEDELPRLPTDEEGNIILG